MLAAILRQAVIDLMACPKAHNAFRQSYRVDSAAMRALDAREFIDSENATFNMICNLLGFDPEWSEARIKHLASQGRYKRGLRSSTDVMPNL